MKKYLTVILLLFFVFMTYNYLTYPNFEEIKNNLKKDYKDYSKGEDIDKLTYIDDVFFEERTNFKFPQEKVSSAKIYGNSFFFSKNLNKNEIEFLLKKFNDSSSFRWGEIGTFINYKTIIFYNDYNKIIGITEVDEDYGQTYSVPMTKKMKWGFLKFKDEKELSFFKEIVDY